MEKEYMNYGNESWHVIVTKDNIDQCEMWRFGRITGWLSPGCIVIWMKGYDIHDKNLFTKEWSSNHREEKYGKCISTEEFYRIIGFNKIHELW